jgi:hypothetical protein
MLWRLAAWVLGIALALVARPLRAAQQCPGTPPPVVTLPERVRFGDFWGALAEQVELLDKSALRPSFAAFAARHGTDAANDGLWQDFARLRLAFEATRDGGFWRLRWRITDQEPSSNEIWKAWLRTTPSARFGAVSTVAECDEITALLSLTARHLGVRGVGLFYPTWNHVIAGWSPPGAALPDGRVVLVPTTQIFQECSATFDETTFKTPKHVYEYPRTDVRDERDMSPQLAAFLLDQVRAYGEASPRLLALVRAKRAELFQSSLGDCSRFRRRLAAELASDLSCADRRLLGHLARVELAQPRLSEAEVLAFLASP